MAESLICTSDTGKPGDGPSSSSSFLFQRRIEFHPARKPFTGFTTGTSDFKLETLNPSSLISSQKPAYQSVSTAKKSDGGDLIELGLDPELSFNITFRRIGAGLENLGNTCFLNSVLQCLTYTEPLAAYLQSGRHKSSCRTAGFCALCAIQNHVRRALDSTGRILAPKDLVMNLRCISRSFRNARQEDAHEYMVNLLESMHKCCLPSGVPSESPSAYEKSLVHKIFGGRLRSQVKCMQCSYCSNTYDPFLDLSLEIMKADSLLKALTHFTAKEQLDGGERQYQCERCKQKVKALKQLTVHKAPYVLTIHLKRFGSHVAGQKIDKKVEFSPTLNLKPFVSGSYEGDLKYTLYGVLVHAGWSTHSGHYYCFVRTSSGMWHSLDDNRVVPVSEKTVLHQKAYMLFYVRDRKNIVPKKPNDVVTKENIVPSALGNKGQSTSTTTNKTVQNGPTARQLIEFSSDSVPFKNPQLKEVSAVKTTTGSIIGESPALVKDSQLKSPSMELLKEHTVQRSTGDQILPESIPKSAPLSFKESYTILPSSVANDGVNIIPENGYQGSSKDTNVPIAAAQPNCNGSQSSGSEELFVDKSIHKVCVGNIARTTEVPCEAVTDLKDKKSDSVRSTNQTGTENNQKGEKVPSEPLELYQKAKENGPTSNEIGLEESSSHLSMENGFVKKGGLDHHHNLKKLLKPKKQLMKFKVPSMFLGPKRLFKTSLSSSKKRKHKKNKRRSLELKRRVQDNLEDGLSGLGPSTSENTKALPLISTHSRKSGNKKGSNHRATVDVRDSIGVSAMNATELDQRFDGNTAVLATNDLPQKSSSSTLDTIQSYSKELGGSQDKSHASGNGSISLPIRSLMETTVARWDGVEPSFSSHILGTNGALSTSIGYVADEWDEEYDRGKRKKVRTPKTDFDGPNLFQEVATMKAHSKKVKLDRSRSGNQPYRI